MQTVGPANLGVAVEPLESRQLFSGFGLNATYYNNTNLTDPVMARVDTSVAFNWKTTTPTSKLSSNHFSARWVGRVAPMSNERYTFFTSADGGVRLWVNGKRYITDYNDNGQVMHRAYVDLRKGHKYDIVLDYFNTRGNANVSLTWATPTIRRQVIGSGNLFSKTVPGLQAEYFSDPSFYNRRITRVDPNVSFNWTKASPDAQIPADYFTARWTGFIEPSYTETYTLYTSSDDGVRVWVDGQLLINNWGDHSLTENSAKVAMIAGQRRNIKIEYRESNTDAACVLKWASASTPKQIVPMDRLYTPTGLTAANRGTGLEAQYFDGTELISKAMSRTDANVNFAWSTSSPDPTVTGSSYSVRWTGQVEPRYSETYTFYATSIAGGMRVWIDGQKIIDNWDMPTNAEQKGTIGLIAGVKSDIIAEFRHSGSAARSCVLSWSSASLAKQVIPMQSLYPAAVTLKPPVPGNWNLTFNDDFDTLNTNVWGDRYWWNSNVGTETVFDMNNVSVNDGALAITAHQGNTVGSDGQTYPFSSGLLTTGGIDGIKPASFTFQYGYVEVRSKIAPGYGMWSAFWMLPASYQDVNGELDVFENLGRTPNQYGMFYHSSNNGAYKPGGFWNSPTDLTKDYHTYAVQWEPGYIAWFIDGKEVRRASDPQYIIKEPMYLIMNLDVGGDWAGHPDSTTPSQSSWMIDYVHVWTHPPS